MRYFLYALAALIVLDITREVTGAVSPNVFVCGVVVTNRDEAVEALSRFLKRDSFMRSHLKNAGASADSSLLKKRCEASFSHPAGFLDRPYWDLDCYLPSRCYDAEYVFRVMQCGGGGSYLGDMPTDPDISYGRKSGEC
jgi:hypothetical protein